MSKVEVDEKELKALRRIASSAVNVAGIGQGIREQGRGRTDKDDLGALGRAEADLYFWASVLVARHGYRWPERVDFSRPENEHLEPI